MIFDIPYAPFIKQLSTHNWVKVDRNDLEMKKLYSIVIDSYLVPSEMSDPDYYCFNCKLIALRCAGNNKLYTFSSSQYNFIDLTCAENLMREIL